ncbi:PREDICTED: retina and anterior neural fold homeobox protein 2-like [Myotis brandtii]|uniref:retina and anterior neural fold homeobox protein 2-like n=1 Tax=Myotis brandtii TaxID=109478 RepID=UPI0007040453|nr:PREDICTED: retina and anterior neural fold homeobox protein 2-like [Myotis brandtii]
MQEPESSPWSPPSPAHRKKKRQKRTVYSIEQRLQLEEFYKKKRYGTYEERETLASQVKVQEHQVQVWLKNRRAKDRRLQRLSGQQGQGAHVASQEPGAPAPQPAPGGPAFQGYPVLPASPVLAASSVFPEEPVFPAGPVLPAAPLHHGGPAFCSPPPHSPFEVFPEADHRAFNYSQACWGPAQGVQGTVPAALAPAPSPAPAQARAWPQGPYDLGCSTNPVVTPRVTELRSPKGPWEGHFSSCQPGAEHEEHPSKLLDL